MGKYIAEQTVKHMIASGSHIKGAKVNVLGLTFKENVPDLRNTRVTDIIDELRSYGVEVFVHDPVALPEEAQHEYGIELLPWDKLPRADAFIAAVAHRPFLQKDAQTFSLKLSPNGCFIDVKSQFDQAALAREGLRVWRL
jgi:UDP-N-acetyl-D-galactosamine dehydrogenase